MSYIKDDLYVSARDSKKLSYLEFIAISEDNNNKVTIGSKNKSKKTKITRVVFSKAVVEEPYIDNYVMFEYQIGSANTEEDKVTLNVDTDWFEVSAYEYYKLLTIVLAKGFKHKGSDYKSVATFDFYAYATNKYTDKHGGGMPKELTLDNKDSSKGIEKG